MHLQKKKFPLQVCSSQKAAHTTAGSDDDGYGVRSVAQAGACLDKIAWCPVRLLCPRASSAWPG